jgi:predicted dehydrogenase
MRLPPAAFLGFGRMGETHLRNLSGLPRVKVVVVADPRREAAALETLRLALAVAKSWRENGPVKLLEIQV